MLAALALGVRAQEAPLAAPTTAAYELPAPPAEEHLDFTADHLDYDRDQSVIHLKGNVRVKESTWTLKGDELWIDTTRRRGRSAGFLFVDDGVSAVSGTSGEFDFEKHAGELRNAIAGAGEWRIHAKSMVLDEKRRLYYRKADFTSCNYVPPHYHFHATRMTVVPGRYLFARNVSFVLGKLPLFYTPFLYKSLTKTHFLRFKLQPGYDRRNGAFLKSTLTTQHNAYWRSKLFLDYYSGQGLGVGGELFHRHGEDSRGALSAYSIHEAGSNVERWSLYGDLYRTLPSSFSLQGRLQAMSDAAFNNDYARSSLSPLTAYLLNTGALVYRRPQVTTRLSYSREDDALGTNGTTGTNFFKTNEDLPRLDIQSAPLKFGKLPWLNTLSGFAVNNANAARGFQQVSVNGGWDATRVFNLSRRVSFTPRLNYNETWYDRSIQQTSLSTVTYMDATVGRYTAAGTVRFKSIAGDLDLTQTYTRRLKVDALTDDASAVDYGVESNQVAALHAFRPARTVLLRAQSAYDFRNFRDHTVGFRDRVQPIVGEAYFTPKPTLNLSLRDDYQLASGNRAFILNGTWGEEERTFLTVGGGYNLADAIHYYVNTEFGWANSTGTLHVTAALRSQVASPGGFGGAREFKVFEKEFTLVKRWHDFYTKLMGRLRPGNVKEISVRVEMKFGGFDADRQKVQDWESEWFPERAHGREDRP